jgi:hypothetical protein
MSYTKLDIAMPAFIECIGPAAPLFAEAAVHVRNGYIFHPDRAPQIYENGNAHFFLIMGNPGQAALDLAKESRELHLRQAAARYEEDIKRQAQAMIEQNKRDEIAKQMAEVEANHARAMEKLKREAEAELAAISQ